MKNYSSSFGKLKKIDDNYLEIKGIAYSGNNRDIISVEISINEGENWIPADLENLYQDSTVADVLDKSLELAKDSKGNDSNISESTVSYAHTPILYFSGISNSEMMKTYNIIAGEIYQETQGAAKAACAKVVTPALKKNFRQLLEEISGDHAEAMKTVDDGNDEA